MATHAFAGRLLDTWYLIVSTSCHSYALRGGSERVCAPIFTFYIFFTSCRGDGAMMCSPSRPHALTAAPPIRTCAFCVCVRGVVDRYWGIQEALDICLKLSQKVKRSEWSLSESREVCRRYVQVERGLCIFSVGRCDSSCSWLEVLLICLYDS